MKRFEPGLSLVRLADGTYSLYSVMLLPDTSWHVARAELGLPPGRFVTPETQPVLLPVLQEEMAQLPVMIPAVHELHGLKPSADKQTIAAFVVAGRVVVGEASIAVSGAPLLPNKEPPRFEPSEEIQRPLGMRLESVVLSSGGNDEIQRLGQLVRNHLPFLNGTERCSYVVVSERPERGLERCTVCGATANMGEFTLDNQVDKITLTLPYIAVHALAEHGDAHYQGELHDGLVEVKKLERLMHFDLRELGRLLTAYLDNQLPLPPHVTIERHPLRGIELCKVCGASVNMGGFLVARGPKKIELPYLAPHSLARHGSAHYEGTLHEGEIPVKLLREILGLHAHP